MIRGSFQHIVKSFLTEVDSNHSVFEPLSNKYITLTAAESRELIYALCVTNRVDRTAFTTAVGDLWLASAYSDRKSAPSQENSTFLGTPEQLSAMSIAIFGGSQPKVCTGAESMHCHEFGNNVYAHKAVKEAASLATALYEAETGSSVGGIFQVPASTKPWRLNVPKWLKTKESVFEFLGGIIPTGLPVPAYFAIERELDKYYKNPSAADAGKAFGVVRRAVGIGEYPDRYLAYKTEIAKFLSKISRIAQKAV